MGTMPSFPISGRASSHSRGVWLRPRLIIVHGRPCKLKSSGLRQNMVLFFGRSGLPVVRIVIRTEKSDGPGEGMPVHDHPVTIMG